MSGSNQKEQGGKRAKPSKEPLSLFALASEVKKVKDRVAKLEQEVKAVRDLAQSIKVPRTLSFKLFKRNG